MRMVALLRGINVGRGKRVAMADLRQAAESLGWRDVTTVLAAGTVVFSGPRGATPGPARLATGLQTVLRIELGLVTRVVVLSASEVGTVIQECPSGAGVDNPSRLLGAAYLERATREKLEPLMAHDWSPGALSLGQHAAYLWCPDGILASPLVAAAARATADGLTSRNWRTWQKIEAIVNLKSGITAAPA